MKTRLVSSDILFVSSGGENDRRKLTNMKQYKIQELVGNTKKLPCPEKLFYETLISFRKLPECAELFLPLQIHSHFKSRRNSSKLSDERWLKDFNLHQISFMIIQAFYFVYLQYSLRFKCMDLRLKSIFA